MSLTYLKFTGPMRGISINEGGRYATFALLTWREPTQDGRGMRRWLLRLWAFRRELVCVRA